MMSWSTVYLSTKWRVYLHDQSLLSTQILNHFCAGSGFLFTMGTSHSTTRDAWSKKTSPWQLVEDRRMKGWIDSLEHQKTPTTTLAPWETMELTSCFGGKAPWDLVRADDHCELSAFVSVLKRFWEQLPVETTWWFRKRCYCKWQIDENCWRQIFWYSFTAFLFFGYDNQFADADLVGSCSAAKSLVNSSIHQGFGQRKSFGNGIRVNTL